MERRREPRQPRRLSCELWLGDKRHTGIVRDVSERGLFVQTRLRAAAGTELEIAFPADGERGELRLMVRVARREVRSVQFSETGAGGLGLETLEVSEGLAPLLGSAGFEARAPAPVADAQAARPFRVRLKQIQGRGTRTLSLSAPSLQGARARALQRVGRGWKVADVSEG